MQFSEIGILEGLLMAAVPESNGDTCECTLLGGMQELYIYIRILSIIYIYYRFAEF